jgi:cardiolipin synthase C
MWPVATPLLDHHPNIEIRIYNPSSVRDGQGKWLAFFADFERMNRRMHNKTFVVDGAVGIAGGRNIGDEYFDLHEAVNFRDRDVLAAGPVVNGLAANFSAYWNSQWSLPISRMTSSPSAEDYQQGAEKARSLAGDTSGLHTRPPQNGQEASAALAQTVKEFIWAPAELIFDPPMEEADAATDQPKETARALRALVDNSEREILVESAYFILAGEQLDVVERLHQRGVRLAAITNSLASNDLVSNHAGYARWRMPMLAKGLEIHELRTDAEACKIWIASPEFCGRGAVSLHAKSAVFDRKTVFIGSFNVNLRSIYLNGETVLIIHSAELAERVAKDIDVAMAPANSWQLSLHEGKRIIWSAGDQAWSTEPETDWWRRAKSGFFATLPVEKYL